MTEPKALEATNPEDKGSAKASSEAPSSGTSTPF